MQGDDGQLAAKRAALFVPDKVVDGLMRTHLSGQDLKPGASQSGDGGALYRKYFVYYQVLPNG